MRDEDSFEFRCPGYFHCRLCDGTGRRGEIPCPECKGSGYVKCWDCEDIMAAADPFKI